MKKAIVRVNRRTLGDSRLDPDHIVTDRSARMAALIASAFFTEWPHGLLDIGFPDDDDWERIYPNGYQIECLGSWEPREEDDLGLIVLGVREEGEWFEE